MHAPEYIKYTHKISMKPYTIFWTLPFLLLISIPWKPFHISIYGYFIIFNCHFNVWRLAMKDASVQFSRSVVSDSLRPHELQHSRPPYPSPTPGVHSNSTSIVSGMPSSHLILCHPLLLLPPVPPSFFSVVLYYQQICIPWMLVHTSWCTVTDIFHRQGTIRSENVYI